MGGLAVSTVRHLDIDQIGFRPDDFGYSFTVLLGFCFFREAKHDETETFPDPLSRIGIFQIPFSNGGLDRCAKALTVKRAAQAAFQLESLILAQNERWRQA